MNCLPEHVGEPDARGWRKWRCVRCQKQYPHQPNRLDRIEATCRGIPFAWEWGHWLTIWLGLWGISEDGIGWWLHRFGIRARCGCSNRAVVINTIGARVTWLWKAGKTQAMTLLSRYNSGWRK